jgi:hypothetical protein
MVTGSPSASVIRLHRAVRSTLRGVNHGLIRVCAHLPEGDFDLTGLRVLLTADILARATELRGRQAFIIWASAGQQDAAAFNIHPPALRIGSEPADGAADVHVVAGVRHVKDADEIVVAEASLPVAPAGRAADHEPLAVRLALLSRPYQEPADLTRDLLADAQATLAGWRTEVARWAELPSRRVPEHIMTEFREAAGQLDTPAVVEMLRAVVAADALPPGARFETFLYADRVLALDLPSDIGRAAR